ncbi:MAG: hypothetical protein CL808_03850 [Citromicrobium sp.]|nr:hypothetical protein [Citromicrobium sp.]
MKPHRFLAPLCLIALGACSADPADETPGEETAGATKNATAEGGVENAPSSASATDESNVESAGGYDPDSSEPQLAGAAEFAEVAKARLADASEWKLRSVVELKGPVGNTILDEPPYAYIAFGRGPTDVDLFAEMEPRFAQQQQYGRDDFYDSDGNVSVMCMGPVTQVGPDSPPLVAGCTAAFRD